MNRPTIVCLIGSSKFKAEHEEAQAQETILGKIVLPMGMYGHLTDLDMTGEIKARLDVLHRRKIDLADEVLLVNPDGYVGQSTVLELVYAYLAGKPVFALELYQCLSESIEPSFIPFYAFFLATMQMRKPKWVKT